MTASSGSAKCLGKQASKKIHLVFVGRRLGDAEIVYAATAKAEKELKWKFNMASLDPNENNMKSCRAKYGAEEMCTDMWNWASKNPYGYARSPYKSNIITHPSIPQ
ncbi:unnamed protein product [Miscanthus lutarioriparius]|uniref:Uncharacterized protein n=1 Tax=Miscanthus lutarioriparius TaxID=422564 RepID=A0A811S607_9POAL|nr:unnamed protein product [Miscanthus lutarioriparius]